MKRKIVLHGPSTLTISLPSKWAKKYDLKKGDELDIEEVGNELKVKSLKEESLSKKEVDVSNLERLGKSYLTSSYRQGYNEIEVKFENSSYIKTIQEVLSREITGFEIIRQTGNSCLIRDLTGQNKDEFETILKSIWILMLDISKESFEAIKDKNKDKLANIPLIDQSINKFSNYCLRILINSSKISHKKSYLHYFLVRSLENIADKYKDMCNFLKKNPKSINSQTTDHLFKVNNYLEDLFELFYRFNDKKAEDFFKKTKKTLEEISNSPKETTLFISAICTSIRDLCSIIVEIKI